MKVKWKFLNQNICSGQNEPVAIMSKEDGTIILKVFENGDRHTPLVSPLFKFIVPLEVTYKTESSMITPPTDYTNYLDKVLQARLEVCSKLIEDDFFSQVAAIKRALL